MVFLTRKFFVICSLLVLAGCATTQKEQDPGLVHSYCYSYSYGVNDVEQDYEQAFKWCSEGAEMGVPSSQVLLAEMYLAGNGAAQNISLAAKYYLLAAENNHPHAQFMTYQIFNVYGASWSSSKEKQLALDYLIKAADSGYQKAIDLREQEFGTAELDSVEEAVVVLNANEEFERFYLALGIDDIIRSFTEEEIKNDDGVRGDLSHLPAEVREALNRVLETSKTITNIEDHHKAAKEAFRVVVMGVLTAEELALAADFYSSEVGLKIHRIIIDGENAVTEYYYQ